MIGIDPDETKYDEDFIEDKPDPPIETKKENQTKPKVEEDDVLEQYFSKKSKRFSSWTRTSTSQVSKPEKMSEENDNQNLVRHFTIFLELITIALYQLINFIKAGSNYDIDYWAYGHFMQKILSKSSVVI